MSTSAISPSFSEVADFVCGFIGLADAESITQSTRLDADLGVTGGDGEDLLREAATRFNSQLAGPDGYITTFGLAQNECLFGSEGLDLFGIGALTGRLLGQRKHIVRDLTVGELHAAICRYKVAAVGATEQFVQAGAASRSDLTQLLVRGGKVMTNPKEPTIGFDFEDCNNIQFDDVKVIGMDKAVRAVRTSNLKATRFVVVAPEVSEALARQNGAALVHALGLPATVPPAVVGEALRQFADNRSNRESAQRRLRESALAQRIGAAADLATLSDKFLQIIQSGALAKALSCLFS